ncbi:MAG: hypothetical protein KA371_18275 [Acidobacteria bacterium]|nr:hypothetical protein [Acidobacteriota bacterium]
MTSSSAAVARPVAATPSRARQMLMPLGALVGVMSISFAVAVGVMLWVLVGLDGWTYYGTPFSVRGYSPAHPLLRPSGPVGQTLGVAGAALMLVPFIYMVRKRLARGRSGANLKRWLEVHIFCGIVGPVLVTFHTAFKFNGIVSAAYWSMVLVALSGFVGRYLYVRIPRTIRGVELSQGELDERMSALLEDLQWTAGPGVLDAIDGLDADITAAAPRWWQLGSRRSLAASIQTATSNLAIADAGVSARLAALLGERAELQQRRHALDVTKRIFNMWHVFHLPLVWIMFAIVSLHVAVALYLGYVPFRW